MVEMEIDVVKRFCDYCREEADFFCQICGRDVCNQCHGVVRFERISFQDETGIVGHDFILCKNHFNEVYKYIKNRLLVSVE
jgi:hypothetical protein